VCGDGGDKVDVPSSPHALRLGEDRGDLSSSGGRALRLPVGSQAQLQGQWFGSADDYAKLFEKEFKYPAPYQRRVDGFVLVFADSFSARLARSGKGPRRHRQDHMMTFFAHQVRRDGQEHRQADVLYQVREATTKCRPDQIRGTKMVYPRR